jgi:hypothetical protein
MNISLPYLVFLLLLASCAGPSRFIGIKEVQKRNTVQQAYIGNISQNADFVKIISAECVGNKLTLAVTFWGGCLNHKFDLVGAKEISKSNPPRRAIKLLHFAMGDTCQQEMKTELQFNIEPFAYSHEKGSEIFLDLTDFHTEIIFKKD